MDKLSYRQPNSGQPFWRLVEGAHQESLVLDNFAGRFCLICCYGSIQLPAARIALQSLRDHEGLFDDVRASFVGAAINPAEPKPRQSVGVHFYGDDDGMLSRHCGSSPLENVPLGHQYRVTWTVVDPTSRVVAHFETSDDRSQCDAAFDLVAALLDPKVSERFQAPAPILIFPNLFEPAFCDRLIALYEAGDPRDSGYMVRNVEKFNYSFKRRRDYFISDQELQKVILTRIGQCVAPEIRKLFFIGITRMERYLVARYSADEAGHFRAHRDNGQTVTAHRQFALTVALNDDFEGGELYFPEYNRQPHKTPKGWGLVFPCAALHAVSKVTLGNRFVFLPFLYDEEGARLKAKWDRSEPA